MACPIESSEKNVALARSDDKTGVRQRLLREMSDVSKNSIIAEVTATATKLFQDNNLNVRAFEAGLVNLLLAAYILGGYPAYFPLYATAQAPILFAMVIMKWYKSGKLLYLTELCWVVNAAGWMCIAVELGASMSMIPLPDPKFRFACSQAFFAVSNGPLLAFVVVGKNSASVVFHEVERTASLFIHFFPAVISWIVRWRSEEVMKTWPGAFGLSQKMLLPSEEQERIALEHMFTSSLAIYFTWWGMYGVWLLMMGCTLPSKYNMKSSFADMAPVLIKAFKIKKENLRAQAAAYLVVHAFLSSLVLYLARFLYASCALHSAAVFFCCCWAIHNGAQYYHYSFGPKFSKALKETLAKEYATSDWD